MKIEKVRFYRIKGHIKSSWLESERSVNPLDIYPEFRMKNVSRSQRDTVPIESIYLEILTDNGLGGLYGPIVYVEQAFVIHKMFEQFLIGQNPLKTELLWDQMFHLDRHARSGLIMMAISAIDCALWDLKGKYYSVPIYELLGGATREYIEAYASTLGHSLDLSLVKEIATNLKKEGYKAQKWFFRYGPGHSGEGIKKNVALVKVLRETLGEECELMFDCWMGWDLNYTIAISRCLSSFKIKWLEEPIPPNDLNSYEYLSNKIDIPLAAGEHLYTRWEFKPFLDNKILCYLQPDPDWTGGITELRKIGELARLYGIKMIPHGCTMHAAIHVVASLPPSTCPCIEYLLFYQEKQQYFHAKTIKPVNGKIFLPTEPGLGIKLDESKIEAKELITFN